MHEDYVKIGSPEDRVLEECGEVVKAIAKARRFGLLNHHPDRPDSTNVKEILEEMADARQAFSDYEKYLAKVCLEPEFFGGPLDRAEGV